MAYNKDQVSELAVAFKGAIEAVKDGVGVEDTGAAIALFTALAGAADEFKADTDAAVLHFVAKVLDLFGDERVDAIV